MLCGHEVGCKGRSLHGEGIFFYIYTLKLSLCQLVLALGLGNERQLELCSEAQPQPSCLCFDLPGRQRSSSESSDRRGRITTLPLYGSAAWGRGCRRAVLFPHLPSGAGQGGPWRRDGSPAAGMESTCPSLMLPGAGSSVATAQATVSLSVTPWPGQALCPRTEPQDPKWP